MEYSVYMRTGEGRALVMQRATKTDVAKYLRERKSSGIVYFVQRREAEEIKEECLGDYWLRENYNE